MDGGNNNYNGNMNNNMNNNVTSNTKVVKVVKRIPTVSPKQIPINAQDAVNMARQNAEVEQQQALNPSVPSGGIVMTPINLNPEEEVPMDQGYATPMPMPMQNNGMNYGEYSEEDVNMVNDVNDLVKVVDVKYSKKTVLIMVAVIAVLVIIFLIFELPLLMEL